MKTIVCQISAQTSCKLMFRNVKALLRQSANVSAVHTEHYLGDPSNDYLISRRDHFVNKANEQKGVGGASDAHSQR